MAFGFKRTIQSKGPDRFIINLRDDLREVIAAVCDDVLGALDDEDTTHNNPMLRRVFPVAHASDESVNEAYRDLVHSDLLRTRREALERVSATANATELDRATLETWMVGLNTVRLVLGTRLDVSEVRFPELVEDDPELSAWALYEFLGVLVGMVVDALARTSR
jgi:hypothetical protein